LELRDREEREYWQERITTRCGDPVVAISDKAEWAVEPVTRQASGCPYLIRTIWFADGRTGAIPKECRSWTHQSCAERRAWETIHHLHQQWGDRDLVWYTTFRDDPAARDRLRQRRKGGVDQYISVRRTDRWVHLFSTEKRDGRLPPSDWTPLDPKTAMEVLAAGTLRLPGVIKTYSSARWRVPHGGRTDEPDGLPKINAFGVISDERWDDVLVKAAEVVRVRFRCSRWDPHHDPLPENVPIGAWVEAVDIALWGERADSR
jgi:hypothetical protein